MRHKEAVALAIEAARSHKPSYFEEPFHPHDWVVAAVLQAYTEGRDDGYSDGRDDGYDDGYENGYDSGYEAGKE